MNICLLYIDVKIESTMYIYCTRRSDVTLLLRTNHNQHMLSEDSLPTEYPENYAEYTLVVADVCCRVCTFASADRSNLETKTATYSPNTKTDTMNLATEP